jgi:general secretion pathway protein L
MADAVLGLQIRKTLVRAVLTSRKIRGGVEILAMTELAVEGEGGIEDALSRLLEQPSFRRGRRRIACSSGQASFRSVHLPFKNRKRIAEALPFELEPQLPQGIEDMVVDFLVQERGDGGDVLAAAVPKGKLTAYVKQVEGIVGRVDLVDMDAFAIAACLLEKKDFGGGSCVVLDVGSEGCVAVYCTGGAIVGGRCLPAPAEGREGRLALVEEIGRTGEMLQWRGILPSQPEVLYLTGEGAADTDLRADLEDRLGLTPELLDLARELGVEMPQALREQWRPGPMNLPLALALRSPGRGAKGFNLRRLVLDRRRKYEEYLPYAKWAAAFVLVAAILAMVDLYLDYALTQARVQRLKSEIRAVFRQGVPDVEQIVDPLQQLQGLVAEARKLSRSLREVQARTSVLDLLRDVSTLPPRRPLSILSNSPMTAP